MKQLLILTDYRDMFWVSVENLKNYTSMDTAKIAGYFKERGFTVSIQKYSQLDYTKSYKGVYVIYQTAEDIGTFYKDYIEDIILFLKLNGAILLPDFDYFRAHHNKNYMELLRYTFTDEDLKTISSKLYGNGNDALTDINDYPVVIKAAEGAGSRYVVSANNSKELKRAIKKLSAVFIVSNLKSVKDFIIYYVCGKLFRKVQSIYRGYAFYRKKFVIQNFIDKLDGDYKVLYYGGKYYTLYRKNRNNDFRASGGGRLFKVPKDENTGLLEYANKVVNQIDFPIIGMDVGYDGTKYHLIEFQMMHLGPYTLQASDYWFEHVDDKWVMFEGKSNLEDEFSRSIYEYIERLESKKDIKR